MKFLVAPIALALAGCTLLTSKRVGDRPGDAEADLEADAGDDAVADAEEDAPPVVPFNIGDSCGNADACTTPETPHCLLDDPPLIGGDSLVWQDGYCTSTCDPSLHQPCGSTAVCGHMDGRTEGMCFAGCSIVFKCRNGYRCDTLGSAYLEPASNTVCLPDPEPISSQVGSACLVDADCGDGLVCRKDFFPGGYCTTACADACPDGSECVSTSHIYDVGPRDTSWCFVICGEDADCRVPQYKCKRLESGDPTHCLPATVGSPCATDEDCWVSSDASSLCLGEHMGGIIPGFFDHGYCSADCMAADVYGGENPCGADAACVRLFNTGGIFYQYCLATCETGRRDCRPGYSCTDLPSGGETRTVCIPSGLSLVAPTPG
jgi:hypothetical protein